MPQDRLYDVLLRARQIAPRRALELNADRHAKLGLLTRILKTARDAGYDGAYVFGAPHSILEWSAKDSGA